MEQTLLPPPHTRLDQTDRQILSILQENPLLQINYIARKVNKAPSTTSERILRLQSNGTIKKCVALLDREILRRPLLVIILVKLRQHGGDEIQNFIRAICELGEVEFCARMNGEYDLLLHANFQNIPEYNQFLDEKLC